MATDPALLDDLAGRLSGRVLRPSDDGYDAARRVHNGLVDRSPAVIVRCRSAADAAAGVRFARSAGLDVCVRGGGHNVAGRAVADGAVMIDLAEMKGTEVDPAARTVRAEGGAHLGRAERRDRRARPRRHGRRDLDDRHRRAHARRRARLADGEVRPRGRQPAGRRARDGRRRRSLEVTEASDPDLFWALRGGGGNFGDRDDASRTACTRWRWSPAG